MDALDWYANTIPLGIGIFNRDDLDDDSLAARQVQWINVFLLPMDEIFVPYLYRWKNHCSKCGKQPYLSCFDMETTCETEACRTLASEP